MTIFEQTLQDFAGSMGMDQVVISQQPTLRCVFQMANIGLLQFEYAGESEETVAMSLGVNAERVGEHELRRILQETHFRENRTFPFRVALGHSGQLTFLVLMSVYEFTLPNLHQCLESLDQVFHQLSPYLHLTR